MLILHEPDYRNNPFQQIHDTVTTTLDVLAAQQHVLQQTGIGEQGVMPRYDEKVILRKACLRTKQLYLERSPPTSGDSGWYIGPYDIEQSEGTADDPRQYEALYVYQFLEQRPFLLSVLGLPPGFLVIIEGDTIGAVINTEDENIWPA